MGIRKSFIGEVISDKMQKTVVVKISRMSKHAKYGRIAKSYNKFKAHDEKGIAKMGDVVEIEETRPLSKDKRFRVSKLVRKANAPLVVIKGEEELK
jgi:small subunit ribosomal protein S17